MASLQLLDIPYHLCRVLTIGTAKTSIELLITGAMSNLRTVWFICTVFFLINHTGVTGRVSPACEACNRCDGNGACRAELCRYRAIRCAWISSEKKKPFENNKSLEEVLQSPILVSPISAQDKLRIVQVSICLLRDVHPHRFLHLVNLRYDPVPELQALLLRHFDTALEFHLAVREIYSKIGDFHTEYYLPGPFRNLLLFLAVKLTYYYPDEYGPARITIFTARKDNRNLIGAEILAVNGIPILEAVRIAGEKSGGANEAARFHAGLSYIYERYLDVAPIPDCEFVTFSIIDNNQTYRDVTFRWMLLQLPERIVNDHGNSNSNSFNGLETKVVKTKGAELGVLRLDTFEPDLDGRLFLQLVENATTKNENRTLVIDLRGNTGGIIDLAQIAAQLVALNALIEPTRFTMRITNVTTPLVETSRLNGNSSQPEIASYHAYAPSFRRATAVGDRFSGGIPDVAPEVLEHIRRTKTNINRRKYIKYIILVTDAITYSSAEMLVTSLLDAGVAKVVGTSDTGTTGGGGSSTIRYGDALARAWPRLFPKLPEGVDVSVSLRRMIDRRGICLEKFGVRSDVRYRYTKKDRIGEERDGDLWEFVGKYAESLPYKDTDVKTGWDQYLMRT